MAVAKRHRHKYFQADMNGTKVWACALPDCNHYMPDHMRQLVNGKMSICWGCESEINLNPDNMKDIHPVCTNCKLGISPDSPDAITETEAVPLSQAMRDFLEGKS